MASKLEEDVTTVYQCSECDQCSNNLEEATLHAVQEHGEEQDEDSATGHFRDGSSFRHKVQIKEDKDSSDEELPHGRYNGRNNSKKNDWSLDCTRALIHCVHEHYPSLRNNNTKKKPIWERIKLSMQFQIPGVTALRCEQKWKSLLGTHRKYVSLCGKGSGKSRLKKPDFFEEIADIIGSDGEELHFVKNESSFSFPKSKNLVNDVFQSILAEDDGEYCPNEESGDSYSVLNRLVVMMERRERSNEAFQQKVLDIEKEKLLCAQRFVESREKFNAKRLQLMKDWIGIQSTAKKRSYED